MIVREFPAGVKAHADGADLYELPRPLTASHGGLSSPGALNSCGNSSRDRRRRRTLPAVTCGALRRWNSAPAVAATWLIRPVRHDSRAGGAGEGSRHRERAHGRADHQRDHRQRDHRPGRGRRLGRGRRRARAPSRVTGPLSGWSWPASCGGSTNLVSGTPRCRMSCTAASHDQFAGIVSRPRLRPRRCTAFKNTLP